MAIAPVCVCGQLGNETTKSAYHRARLVPENQNRRFSLEIPAFFQKSPVTAGRYSQHGEVNNVDNGQHVELDSPSKSVQ
jgi:hypothetical protein